MAVALDHGQFEHGAAAPDGSAWELFGEVYERNPRLLLTEADLDMLRVWHRYRSGHLPEAGGILDQSSAMMEALDLMESAALERRREKGGRNAPARRSPR